MNEEADRQQVQTDAWVEGGVGCINNRDKPGPNPWDNWELSAFLFLDARIGWSGDRQVSGVTTIAVIEIFLFMALR